MILLFSLLVPEGGNVPLGEKNILKDIPINRLKTHELKAVSIICGLCEMEFIVLFSSVNGYTGLERRYS